ncbi:MBL fold metallo-hydrolase [uncultured Pigmentiphaga sp.]|jgi:Zn-dependent hydrolases, including glyoxylases|uniref:MBL fold metallo-hydrolase n=1 Tax=uncultured Pigmentiphaga sp. TaxID=340361 RepID=UPI0026050282|nr:MBL fold metallo-hydrolase [uncultured Pigmentiphaga sp.]
MKILRDGDCAIYLVGSGGMGISHPTDAHIYLVDGGAEAALIDAGSGIRPERMLENLREDGIPVEKIRQILLTHSHWDHARGCAWWQRLTGADIHGHSLACEVVETAAWSRTHIARRGARLEPAVTHRRLADGDSIHVGKLTLSAIHTPGHSPDSISFVMQLGEQKVLFSGDTVFAEGGHGTVSAETDFRQFLESVRKLVALQVDALLPSHRHFVLSRADSHVVLLQKKLATPWTSMDNSRVPFFPTWWLEHDESLYNDALK